jgi:hypothetical protein
MGFLLFRTVLVMLSICNKRAKQVTQKERANFVGMPWLLQRGL